MARIRTPTADTPAAQIARSVRAEMARRGINQETLAERLGLTQRAMSRRLTADTSFRAEELAAIADVLGVPVATFLRGEVTP